MNVKNLQVLQSDRQWGFSLIELLVVVAIVGILAAVAFPAYREHVLRGKLQMATSALADMRIKLEQFYQDNRTYVGACAGGTVAPLPGGDPARYFDFDCPTLTASAFTARARGRAAEGMNGFEYTIDQANAKSTVAVPAGWSGTGAACWVTRKDGSC